MLADTQNKSNNFSTVNYEKVTVNFILKTLRLRNTTRAYLK